MIKLLIGGSPCTFWSIAQKNGRETEAEGMGWELFKNYLVAKEKFKPDFFLYENNKSAAQPIKDQISRELGVDLMYINSALVSAQHRQRFYAFNWEVEQPEDRGIILKDILESGVDLTSNEKAYTLTASYNGAVPWNTIERSQRNMVAEPVRVGALPRPDGELSTSQAKRVYSIDGKSVNLVANGGGEGAKTGLYAIPYENVGESETIQKAIPKLVDKYGYVPEQFNAYNLAEITDKSPTLSTGSMATSSCATTRFERAEPINITDDGKSQTIKAQYDKTSIANICCYSSTYGATGVAIPTNEAPSEQFVGGGKDSKAMQRVYEVKDGYITIKGKKYPIKLPDGWYIIRKLTPIECERLQTLPDNYTEGVSNSQRYKGLGNGWTAEVIIHILNGALKDVPKDEEIVVLSMYDGIGTGRYCLDKMGFTNVKYFAYEIDKYAKQIAMKNYPDIIQMGDAFDLRHPDWTIGY